MADNWTVVRKRNGRESVIFDGLEDDARAFVANNYPRVHVDTSNADGSGPDVLLKSPSGDYSGHFGPGDWQDTDENGVVADSSDSEDDDDDAPHPAKKATAKKTAAPAFTGR